MNVFMEGNGVERDQKNKMERVSVILIGRLGLVENVVGRYFD